MIAALRRLARKILGRRPRRIGWIFLPVAGGAAAASNDLRVRSTPPTTTVVIAGTQRSGTTLLCTALRSTGQVGAPAEFLSGHELFRFQRRFGEPRPTWRGRLEQTVGALLGRDVWWATTRVTRERLDRYLDQIVARRTTPNGVFAVKVFPIQLERLNASTGFDVDQLPGDKVWVHVERDDVVAQAISLTRARQTGRWVDRGADQAPRAAARYDGDAIRAAIDDLREQQRWWSDTFGRRGISPLCLSYDDIVDDLSGSVAAVVELVGGRLAEPPTAVTKRQADQRSVEMRRRFVAEYPEYGS